MVEVITFTFIVCVSIRMIGLYLTRHPLLAPSRSLFAFQSTRFETAHTPGVAHSVHVLVELHTKIPSMADGGLVVQVTQHQSEVDCSC